MNKATIDLWKASLPRAREDFARGVIAPAFRRGRGWTRPRPSRLVLGARRAWWWVCWGLSWIGLVAGAAWAAAGPIGIGNKQDLDREKGPSRGRPWTR